MSTRGIDVQSDVAGDLKPRSEGYAVATLFLDAGMAAEGEKWIDFHEQLGLPIDIESAKLFIGQQLKLRSTVGNHAQESQSQWHATLNI